MSRKKEGKKEHHGEIYSEFEYNLIFFDHIRGRNLWETARVLGREISGIGNCWRRLCWNATDFPNKRIYKLRPPSDKVWSCLNGYAKEYIEIQVFEVEKKSNARKISEQTAIPVHIIQEWIDTLRKIPRKAKTPSLLE